MQQAAQALRGWGLDMQASQVRVCGTLEGFGMRVEGHNALAEPVHERRLVLGTKSTTVAVVQNLGPMPPARPAHPLRLRIHVWPYPNLLGEVGDESMRNVLTAFGKTPVILKRLEQDGE